MSKAGESNGMDLGFLQKPGIETKAAKDIETFLAQPVRVPGQGRPSGAPR